MKMLKRANRKKLLIGIAAAIVLIAVIAGLVYWLMQSTETGATKSIEKSRSDVGTAVKALNTKIANKEITPKDRLTAFDQFNQTIASIQSRLCKEQKASIVYTFTKAVEQCEESKQRLDRVKTASQRIQEGIKDDQALALIMNPAKTTDPTDPAKQLDIWTTIVSKLQPLKVSESSTELKNTLITTSTAYKAAWQDLITADKEKNKANYEGTIKRLQAVQGTVVKASDQQTAQLKDLLAKFKTAIVGYRSSAS